MYTRPEMKRAVIVSGDLVRTGGMDMANFALARHLANRGVTVHVVAHRIADELVKLSDIKWHKVPKPLNSYSLGAPLLDRIGRRVVRHCAAADCRVVVNGGNCKVDDVNWVHYVHAAYPPQYGSSLSAALRGRANRHLHLKHERAALRMSRLVIANSERTRRDLQGLLGIDGDRIRTVYYGIDPDRFAPCDEGQRQRLRRLFGWPNRPQVAFVGALSDRRKGFDTLYAAWSKLCSASSWDADLVVVGHGAELATWKARALADGLGERIRFLGFRSDVPDILAACDAMVAPTRYEAFGLGVLEALCIGLPAIVSADAGVAERYPHQLKGLLLQDPNSVSELVARLESWRERTAELRNATLQLSATLRERTWETMATEIGALLQ
jgi:glycosyltransferase involved in cell wall biosynthesis